MSSSIAVLAFFFFFNDPATTETYTLSLHDALPISNPRAAPARSAGIGSNRHSTAVMNASVPSDPVRSEEHTSELQSRFDLVCRLLLEKKNAFHPRCSHFLPALFAPDAPLLETFPLD